MARKKAKGVEKKESDRAPKKTQKLIEGTQPQVPAALEKMAKELVAADDQRAAWQAEGGVIREKLLSKMEEKGIKAIRVGNRSVDVDEERKVKLRIRTLKESSGE